MEDADQQYELYRQWVEEQNRKGVEVFRKMKRKNIYVRQYNVELLSKEEFKSKMEVDEEFRGKWGKE
jgi:hypothetical protein